MSESMEGFIFFGIMIWFLGTMIFLFVGFTAKDGDPLLAPVWPIFWLKYVWRKLRE